MRKFLEKFVQDLTYACTGIGLLLAIPSFLVFVVVYNLQKIADDLAGEWRRGREQNWLWRWARNAKE